jgi:hypothetical protein
VAVFKKGAKASDAPAVVLLGERIIEGSMHTDDYTVIIDPKDVEDGKPYFTICHDETCQYVPCKKGMQPL